jgi:hypothetical protein
MLWRIQCWILPVICPVWEFDFIERMSHVVCLGCLGQEDAHVVICKRADGRPEVLRVPTDFHFMQIGTGKGEGGTMASQVLSYAFNVVFFQPNVCNPTA